MPDLPEPIHRHDSAHLAGEQQHGDQVCVVVRVREIDCTCQYTALQRGERRGDIVVVGRGFRVSLLLRTIQCGFKLARNSTTRTQNTALEGDGEVAVGFTRGICVYAMAMVIINKSSTIAAVAAATNSAAGDRETAKKKDREAEAEAEAR